MFYEKAIYEINVSLTARFKRVFEGTETLLEQYDRVNRRSRNTPMEALAQEELSWRSIRWAEDDEKNSVSQSHWWTLTCCPYDPSGYLVSVSMLAIFCSNPGTMHWNTAKGVLRYLASTKDYGIQFRKGADIKLECWWCWLGYCWWWQSQYEWLHLHTGSGGPVTWQSSNQNP